MTTPAEAPVTTGADLSRVGLWGATQSGKSTFLSSLFIAAARAPEHLRVQGNNDESTDFLIRNTHILNHQHRFPPSTTTRQPLSWTLKMWVPNPSRRLLRPGPERVPFDFRVDLQDAGGFEFAAVPEAVPSRLDIGTGAPNIAAYLGGCNGLLLMIDPIRERDVGDAYEYFFGPLLRMAQNVPVAAGERLPHYVAVCVTKFDDPTVYEFARNFGYLSYREDDPVMLPRIHQDEAERFMRHLFEDLPMSDIDLMIGGLRQYFYPERVRLYISTAVGFYVGRSGQFREDDFRNVAPIENGEFAIRGAVRPINVAEPLMWLGESIAAARRP